MIQRYIGAAAVALVAAAGLALACPGQAQTFDQKNGVFKLELASDPHMSATTSPWPQMVVAPPLVVPTTYALKRPMPAPATALAEPQLAQAKSDDKSAKKEEKKPEPAKTDKPAVGKDADKGKPKTTKVAKTTKTVRTQPRQRQAPPPAATAPKPPTAPAPAPAAAKKPMPGPSFDWMERTLNAGLCLFKGHSGPETRKACGAKG